MNESGPVRETIVKVFFNYFKTQEIMQKYMALDYLTVDNIILRKDENKMEIYLSANENSEDAKDAKGLLYDLASELFESSKYSICSCVVLINNILILDLVKYERFSVCYAGEMTDKERIIICERPVPVIPSNFMSFLISLTGNNINAALTKTVVMDKTVYFYNPNSEFREIIRPQSGDTSNILSTVLHMFNHYSVNFEVVDESNVFDEYLAKSQAQSKESSFYFREPNAIEFYSSSGETYNITLNEDKKHSCTCEGFKYRNACKHINTICRFVGIDETYINREIKVQEKKEQNSAPVTSGEELKTSDDDKNKIEHAPAAVVPAKLFKYGLFNNAVGQNKKSIASVLKDKEDTIVTIQGRVAHKEQNNNSVSFYVFDRTETIKVDMVYKKGNEQLKEINEAMKFNVGNWVACSGKVKKYNGLSYVLATTVSEISSTKALYTDNATVKRVELHAHTNMSAMNCAISPEKLISHAAKLGHKTIGITDHNVVQSFPYAHKEAKKHGIKVLYGMEASILNNPLPILYNCGDINDPIQDIEFVVFDIETTGFNANIDKITEIGAVKMKGFEIIGEYSQLINPECEISGKISTLTGITNEMVSDKPTFAEISGEFYDFIQGAVLVAHNANFDVRFMQSKYNEIGKDFDLPYIDTLELAKNVLQGKIRSFRLEKLISYYKLIGYDVLHRAKEDAKATADVFTHLVSDGNFENLANIEKMTGDRDIVKDFAYHATVYATSYIGLKNLYKLVSLAHTEYFYQCPKIPKSEFAKLREGLIIGCGCENSELVQAEISGRTEEEISEIIDFYDFIELQPIGCYKEQISEGNLTSEQIKRYHAKIYNLAKEKNKTVVATGNVHFINRADEIGYKILRFTQSRGKVQAENHNDCIFRSTDEMLAEFNHLEQDICYEIVVTNTNVLADSIDIIQPIPEDTHPPEIAGAEEEITKTANRRAKELYEKDGKLPEIVEKRLIRELEAITKNGFSVMYEIAKQLVEKSNAAGYLVGSRGSVGSSFAAYLCNITEVNPLAPHYICPTCKASEFITDGSVSNGNDLPTKTCECGSTMRKDGYLIPFETFLGFDGDKAPDIDLNFSGEYQSRAHKETENIFGENYVFRAGTINSLASKSAIRLVEDYYNAIGEYKSPYEIMRIAAYCVGVKKTTGQHPGGIIVVPKNKDIYDFSPIQYPADAKDKGITTTHFAFESLHDTLLKLDILGHDDPTMLKMLQEITGHKISDVPLDDKSVMSLFTSVKALKFKEKSNMKVGTLGVPEFGTPFVRQMLVDTKPKNFDEIVRISGLSHGTDVWKGNAKDIISNGQAAFSEIACTRDDIMNTLMRKGVEPLISFKIMEDVRKGKGLKPEYEAAMQAADVPDWFTLQCKKIKYMFPRAHAVAYVIMAYRIAYYKIHYPLEFYAAYFTLRAKDFSVDIYKDGLDGINKFKSEIEEKGYDASQKEKALYSCAELIEEMYLRGYGFSDVDLYKSKVAEYVISDGKILPPLNSLSGLGEKAAQSIVAERQKGEFATIEELQERTGINKTNIQTLKDYGCLTMPESSQLTLF